MENVQDLHNYYFHGSAKPHLLRSHRSHYQEHAEKRGGGILDIELKDKTRST